ncbi:MAG TPA: response regulator, partial [Holophaga sp.]|nr:response regulator [Holophaga sp.]
ASPEAFRWALLDLTMPRRDGRETLKALQALRPGFPVVLCSGYSAQGNLERLDTGQGPVRFLPKPYQLADLRNLLADLLDEGIPKNLPSR